MGLLLDDYAVPAWVHEMIRIIQSSDYAAINLVILNEHDLHVENKTLVQKITRNRGRFFYLAIRKTLELIYSKVIERNTHITNAEEIKNCQPILQSIDTVKVKTERKKWSDYFSKEDISAIGQHSPDILIRCGFGILRGEILSVAKYGIWSYHHGDNTINRGGPAGFWESMDDWSETGSILQILSEDLDNGKVIYQSFSATDRMSVQDNKSNYYWKTLNFIPRKIQELHRLGEQQFFKNVDYQNRHPTFYSERLYTSPGNAELAKLTLKKIIAKLALQYKNRFVLEQWILMFHLNREFSSSLWRYKKILPPKDRFWADPHIIERDGSYYIFIEELVYEKDKGHISLIVMDGDGNYQQPQVVLEKDYHLSYPFVFEHENATYMVPESMENHSIDLYQCTDFPLKWEFKKSLISNISAVDATLLFHNNRWWIFAVVAELDGMSTCDELCIFSSTDLLSDNWVPHPMNPVISDVKCARPAGKLFFEGDRLYRPSQNCANRYGYGFNISEVTVLSETDYQEEIVSRVEPNWDKNILGTHIFNRTGNLHMIDAIQKRKR